MILHLMIVDDEEDVLEALVPGILLDLAARLSSDAEIRRANAQAGYPLPEKGRINIALEAHGYSSFKASKYVDRFPVHLKLHLCCEKNGSFQHSLRLLREHFFAVVVSDLRFADTMVGSRAGKFFIEDVERRNPETFCILYSAYQRPEGFPKERFLRKGSAENLGGDALVERMVEGCRHFLSDPKIRRLGLELKRRGIVYQSPTFGAMLRRLYDYADLCFGLQPAQSGRRRPLPSLLFDGETGTGKTELAGLLHQLSERRNEPFVSATCTQLTDETFLRSTLFGHVKGSFSGASADRPGLVESAQKGILLLDDLHKIGVGGSVILHSFLDDGEYSHLGQDEIRRTSDIGVIVAVETPFWSEIKANGKLPESFINRVEQFVLKVPPLRDRPEDIRQQALTFVEEQNVILGTNMELSDGAIDWLVNFGFAGGNSRKLRDFLRGVIASNARVTDFLDLPEIVEHARESGLIATAKTIASSAQVPTVERSDVQGAATAREQNTLFDDSAGWRPRIAKLAAKALEEELGISASDAVSLCDELFQSRFPELWKAYLNVARSRGKEPAIDWKLFDELFKCFVIHASGSPARAAKELGMKDNALREFIYSREQKRGTV